MPIESLPVCTPFTTTICQPIAGSIAKPDDRMPHPSFSEHMRLVYSLRYRLYAVASTQTSLDVRKSVRG